MKYKIENKRIIPGTYDLVFKSIMQDKKCRRYLEYIIHECTKIDEKYIRKNLVIKNSELPVKSLSQKKKITDLVVEIGKNIINIEMNNYYYKGLFERNDAYLNELRNLKPKEEYSDIPKLIQINFDNFNRFNKTIMKFVIMNEETHIKETDNYEKYHINLKKINEKYYNKEKLNKFEKRLLVLTLDNEEELIKISKGDDMMKKVEEKIIELSEDQARILCYDEEEHKEKVRRAVLITEKEIAKEEGKKEGLEEGKKEGIKKGIEKGIQKGIEKGEKTKQKEIAINMINSNFDDDLISKMTGLSKEELKKIKKN